MQTTATPTYLSELVQTRAPPRALRSSDVRCSSHTHRTGPSLFLCCCFIHLELSACWHSTVGKHSHFQTPLENPSIQTHLVFLCCFKRLCIFGLKGAIQIRYYYYYYYYHHRSSIFSHLVWSSLGIWGPTFHFWCISTLDCWILCRQETSWVRLLQVDKTHCWTLFSASDWSIYCHFTLVPHIFFEWWTKLATRQLFTSR